MCKLSYQQVRRMWVNAEWARDFWLNQDVPCEYLRYLKIANRLYNTMMRYPAENVLLSGER